MDVDIDTARLDRYYSNPFYVDMFGGKVYIIPKRNSTLKGLQKWKDTMKEFVQNTMEYLEHYHQRSNSETGFAADKKMLGWGIAQRRDDIIDSTLFCTGLWHNLFNFDRLTCQNSVPHPVWAYFVMVSYAKNAMLMT
jgi:transposase